MLIEAFSLEYKLKSERLYSSTTSNYLSSTKKHLNWKIQQLRRITNKRPVGSRDINFWSTIGQNIKAFHIMPVNQVALARLSMFPDPALAIVVHAQNLLFETHISSLLIWQPHHSDNFGSTRNVSSLSNSHINHYSCLLNASSILQGTTDMSNRS